MPAGKYALPAIALAAIALSTTAAAAAGKTARTQLERAATAGTGPALGFVENRGQTNTRVRFYAQGDRYAFYVTRNEVLLSFLDRHRAGGLTLALRFLDRNPTAAPEG